MLRSRPILAALLLVALPLNAQMTRVASTPPAPAAVAPAAIPPFAAPAPSAPLALPLSAPELAAAPVAAPRAFAPALPPSAAESPAVVPSIAASLPLAAAGGFRRESFPDARAPAGDSILASGERLFDGSSDLVTRSGSVFSPSRAPQPAILGRIAFVRVKPAPVAPVKPVPNTQGLRGPALLDRVSEIAAKGQTEHKYHAASKYLFSTADNHTLNGVRGVADAYSGVFVPGTSPDGHDYPETGGKTRDGWPHAQVMNVEHGFPQSLFGKKPPMRSDLHILMATFEHPNEARGSLPYGAAKAPFVYHNGAGARSDGRVFEPPDFTKGRVARLMLYFYARYKDEPFFGTPHVAAFWNPQIEILLDWNRRFPPTVEEQRRNDHVQAFQGNRNPFVDDPGLADLIGAEAFRAGPAAQARIRTAVVARIVARRSDKPRNGGRRPTRIRRSRHGNRR